MLDEIQEIPRSQKVEFDDEREVWGDGEKEELWVAAGEDQGLEPRDNAEEGKREQRTGGSGAGPGGRKEECEEPGQQESAGTAVLQAAAPRSQNHLGGSLHPHLEPSQELDLAGSARGNQ